MTAGRSLGCSMSSSPGEIALWRNRIETIIRTNEGCYIYSVHYVALLTISGISRNRMINYYVDIFDDVNYRDLTDFIKSLVPDRYIIHDDLVTFFSCLSLIEYDSYYMSHSL